MNSGRLTQLVLDFLTIKKTKREHFTGLVDDRKEPTLRQLGAVLPPGPKKPRSRAQQFQEFLSLKNVKNKLFCLINNNNSS